MRIPEQRVRFVKSFDGHLTEQGYLVIDLKGLDIEGVTTLVLGVEDVESARSAGDREDDAKRRARELLGG